MTDYMYKRCQRSELLQSVSSKTLFKIVRNKVEECKKKSILQSEKIHKEVLSPGERQKANEQHRLRPRSKSVYMAPAENIKIQKMSLAATETLKLLPKTTSKMRERSKSFHIELVFETHSDQASETTVVSRGQEPDRLRLEIDTSRSRKHHEKSPSPKRAKFDSKIVRLAKLPPKSLSVTQQMKIELPCDVSSW